MTSSRDEVYALLRVTEDMVKQDQCRFRTLEQEIAELKVRLAKMEAEAAKLLSSSKSD